MRQSQKRIRKVMLIFPPVVFSTESPKQIMPPLGIGYLGAYLRDDYEVRLLDAALEGYDVECSVAHGFRRYGLTPDQIKARVEEFSPDVVGISCLYSSQFEVVAEICKSIKSVSGEIITVSGGTHPSFLPQVCLNSCSGLDFIVLGEGEDTFKRLLDSFNKGSSYYNIDGIAFKDNGQTRVNPKKDFIENIDDIAYPARDLLNLEKYFKIDLPMGLISRQSPAMNMITSRGCPYECSFCSSSVYWGRNYRMRSAENVLDEMARLKRIGVKEIKFFDDNLTLDKQRAKKIFQGMIDRKFNFTWNTPNGIAVWTIDEELIELMKKSGCYEITLAIESGDKKTLRDIIKKPIDLDKALQTAKMIARHGIDTYGFFIIGFPQETKQGIYNTLKFMELIKLDRVSLFLANPLPGTEIYKECIKRGYLSENSVFLDYFKSSFKTENFDRKFLESLRRKWYWKYNLKLILRNPFKFFKIYYKFIFRKPLYLIRAVFSKFIIPELKT
ncbi:MAG: B12-binding domain-containing radical SAM protein [Candidatus Omnitrophica bacterium]|nr:B12-binding domain-containing radical SAM protein [Candidatus Omnitrophota bacterium]